MGDKVSYMGVYDSSIIFPQKPGHRPLFSMALKLTVPFEQDLDSIEFEITDDEDFNLSTKITKEDIENSRNALVSSLNSAPRVISYKCAFQVGGLNFNSPGKLRTFAKFNNTTVEGDSLDVVFTETQNKSSVK
jgi:hypothetical protein